MGKSQTRRLREAANRFGREDFKRWLSANASLSSLANRKKTDVDLSATVAIKPVSDNSTLVKRYSSSLTYEQNELTYGRSMK